MGLNPSAGNQFRLGTMLTPNRSGGINLANIGEVFNSNGN